MSILPGRVNLTVSTASGENCTIAALTNGRVDQFHGAIERALKIPRVVQRFILTGTHGMREIHSEEFLTQLPLDHGSHIPVINSWPQNPEFITSNGGWAFRTGGATVRSEGGCNDELCVGQALWHQVTSPIFTPKTSFSRIISDFSLFSWGFSKFDDDISVENRKKHVRYKGDGMGSVHSRWTCEDMRLVSVSNCFESDELNVMMML